MKNLRHWRFKTLTQAAVVLATCCAAATVQAEMNVNLGIINVNLDSDLSSVAVITSSVDVGSGTTLGFTFDYFVTPNIAVELIAALPFKHEIRIESGTLANNGVGETKQLPPTLMAQYHVGAQSEAFRLFVGFGVNYTGFFEESADGDLRDLLGDNTQLVLDSSYGLAGQIGFNYAIDAQWGVHAVATYVDIDTDATIIPGNGGDNIATTVAIDPWVVMLGANLSF